MGRFALICLALALAAQCLNAESAAASEVEYSLNIPESAVVHVTVPGLENSHAQEAETESEAETETATEEESEEDLDSEERKYSRPVYRRTTRSVSRSKPKTSYKPPKKSESKKPEAKKPEASDAETAEALEHSCYIDSYGRGAGYPLTECNSDEEKSGLLCYPKCRPGFTGAAFACWANCPSGFHDIGMFCQKPAAYGRGGGYVLWDKNKCNRQNRQGCERNGLLYYPRCNSGYHAFGCCICTPNCPSGMSDTGTGCAKPSYTRGAGHILRCRPGLEQNGLLCGVFCLKGQTCLSKIANIVQGVVDLALDVASVIPGAQALKGAKMAMKAAKLAGKGAKVAARAAKVAAKAAMKEALKEGGKKLKKEAIKRGKEALKETAKGVAQGLSPKEIADSVLEAVVPGYSLGKEFVAKKCIDEGLH